MEDSAITKSDTIQQYDGLLGLETLHPPVFHSDLLRGTELCLSPDYFGDLIRKETGTTAAISVSRLRRSAVKSRSENRRGASVRF